MLSKIFLLAGAFGVLATAVLAQPAQAPRAAAPPPRPIQLPAEADDGPYYFSAETLQALAKAPGAGLGVLNKGSKYVAEIAQGGADAEVHDHFGDLIIVLSGSTVMEYGGTITGNKETMPGSGEWRGGIMSGYKTAELRPGDYFHVPAGMPHKSTIPRGVNFKMLLIKIAP